MDNWTICAHAGIVCVSVILWCGQVRGWCTGHPGVSTLEGESGASCTVIQCLDKDIEITDSFDDEPLWTKTLNIQCQNCLLFHFYFSQ